MKDYINRIRGILDEIEVQSFYNNPPAGDPDFSALELPAIIQEIVDDLQPLLTPYNVAIYWYAFRHSIASTGSPYIRLSTRKLGSGVVKSAASKQADNRISQLKVMEILRELEAVGAIRKEGEPNRDGTPYRVLIPDEIEACRALRAERTVDKPAIQVSEAEIDYYNVKENRVKVFERDNYKCHYCQKQLTRFTATLDHVKAVTDGGINSFDNLLTACLNCNSRKNRRLVGDFLAEG